MTKRPWIRSRFSATRRLHTYLNRLEEFIILRFNLNFRIFSRRWVSVKGPTIFSLEFWESLWFLPPLLSLGISFEASASEVSEWLKFCLNLDVSIFCFFFYCDCLLIFPLSLLLEVFDLLSDRLFCLEVVVRQPLIFCAHYPYERLLGSFSVSR